MSTAVVVGGGISGLSAAYYLQKSSKFSKIVVLEASSRVGGWMHSVKASDGGYFELGPHSIRPVGVAGKNTLNLIDELGLAEAVVGVPKANEQAKNRYLYVNGKIHSLPNNRKFMNLFRKSPPFSRSLYGYMIKERLTKADPKEDETIYDFVSRRIGSDVAEYGLDPFCRGIFAGDIRQLSVKSCTPFSTIYELERDHGGIILGMINKMVENRMNPPKAPEDGSPLAKKAASEFWTTYTLREGTQQLPNRILDVLKSNPNVDIHMNTPCEEISFKDNKAEVTINGEKIHADHVVSSIFAKDTGRLLEKDENLADLTGDLKSIPGVDVVVVCLEYDQADLVKQPGFGHLLPSSEDSKMLGVIYDSCMFPELDAPDRKTTRLTAMMGGAWYADLEKAVPSMSEADLGKFAANQVASQLGIDLNPTKVFVGKHADCIPQYVIGHSKKLERIFNFISERSLPFSVVGCSYKGPSINDCINNTKLEIQNVTGVTM